MRQRQQLPGIHINMEMPTGRMAIPEPPKIVQGATQTKKLPLVQFGGDILVVAGLDVIIDVTEEFGERCVGFSILQVTGTIRISINGGSFRTVTSDSVYDDCKIENLRVLSSALSSAIVQLHGV